MDGGELRAFFKGAAEDTAQAVESAGKSIADFGDQTAQNVLDSVKAVEDADGAGADSFAAIRRDLCGENPRIPQAPSSSPARAEGNEPSWIARLLSGEDAGTDEQPPPGMEAAGPLKWAQNRIVNRSVNKALERVNPKFDPAESAYRENCTSVVQANELRRRGLDVQAGPLERHRWSSEGGSGGRPLSAITGPWGGQFTPGTKTEIERAFEDPGSRGIVAINWHEGGGHVFNVENVGGQIRFVDGQPTPPVTDASYYFNMGHNTAYIRLDGRPTPPEDATKPYLEP